MLLIDKLSGKPVYEQIIEGMEKNILMGVYPEGSVLPSLRELSVTLGINPNTIQKSYAELIRRGVIVPSPGSGTYVAVDARARIREAAAGKLSGLEELVAELALADVPKGDVLATVCAVYARVGKSNTPAEPDSAQEGGKQS
ncbi:MAG: GntR family transcriptional regulator [Clostridia bacterium]|nr:GntR family transcriptional regulator [Clostridia bacterium]